MTEDISTDVQAIQKRAETMAITNDKEYKAAAILLQQDKAMQKRADEIFGPSKASTYKAHKDACSLFKRVLDPLKAAETRIKEVMGTYDPEGDPKAPGISRKTVYTAVVTDMVALCKGVADGTVPPSYVQGHQVSLDWVGDYNAREGGKPLYLPGVEWTKKVVITCRTGEAS